MLKKKSIIFSNILETSESGTTKDALEWLKNNYRSVAQIQELWQATTIARLTYLKKSEISVHDYMDQFKALKLSDGYQFVNYI